MNAPTLFDDVAGLPTVLRIPAPTPQRHLLQAQRGTILPPGGTEQDSERALRLVAAIAPETGEMRFLRISGEPASKARPRFTRTGKPYRTKEDVDAEKRTAYHVRQSFAEPWTGNVALGCVFFRPNRQRIDVDNMLKHICDAANGIAWIDDSQITAVYGVAELDAEHPRTLLVFAHHESSLTRGTDIVGICAGCNEPFLLPRNGHPRKFCTPECMHRAKGQDLATPVECKQCHQMFRRTTSGQKMCSPTCRSASVRGHNKPRASERSKCTTCGKQLAHKRGGRCRACWSMDPHPVLFGGDE